MACGVAGKMMMITTTAFAAAKAILAVVQQKRLQDAQKCDPQGHLVGGYFKQWIQTGAQHVIT